MPKFWITYTEVGRTRIQPFRPNHMVPANRYVTDGEWLIFTDDSFDGTPHHIMTILSQDVERIEWVEDQVADQRRDKESSNFGAGAAGDGNQPSNRFESLRAEPLDSAPARGINASADPIQYGGSADAPRSVGAKHSLQGGNASDKLTYVQSDEFSFGPLVNAVVRIERYKWDDPIAQDREALELLLLDHRTYEFLLTGSTLRENHEPGVHGPYWSSAITSDNFTADISAASVLMILRGWVATLAPQPAEAIVNETLRSLSQLTLSASSRFQLEKVGTEIHAPPKGSRYSPWYEFVLVDRNSRTVALVVATSGQIA